MILILSFSRIQPFYKIVQVRKMFDIFQYAESFQTIEGKIINETAMRSVLRIKIF